MKCPGCKADLKPNDTACPQCGIATPHARTIRSDEGFEAVAAPSDYLARLTAALSGKYALESELGQGGMATVYLAEDLKHERKVAVKVMRPELAAAIGSDRFVREIKLAAQLNHPHLLPLFDSGEADGFLYYVMPFVEGETLRDRLNREKQLPIEEAIRLTQEVAAALSYAHSHGVVHRDIKPENILLSHGEAVVADLGIAKAITESGGERFTETGLAIGTPTYMSPEQSAGEEVDGRADTYSLACVLFEMFTGEPPFTGATAKSLMAKHAMEPVPSPRVVRQAVPEYVESAVQKALGKVPADRFQVVSQFAEALVGTSASSVEPIAPKTPLQPSRGAGLLGPTVPLALVSTAAIAWLWFGASKVASSVPSFAGAWLMTVLGVWFLFDRAEVLASQETKAAVAKWIDKWDPSTPSNWPYTFAAIFDRVFGEQHLTLKCLWRSSLASVIAVVTLLLLFVAGNGVDPLLDTPLEWLLMLMFMVPNIMADYFSLLETRIVIKWMARSRSVVKQSALLVGDLVATALIFTLPWTYFFASSALLDPNLAVAEPATEFWLGYLPGMVLSFPLREGASWEGVFFYSTFFTSAWIWLFLISGLIVRVAGRVGGVFNKMLSMLNVEEQPIRSLGFVGMMVVSVGFTLIPLGKVGGSYFGPTIAVLDTDSAKVESDSRQNYFGAEITRVDGAAIGLVQTWSGGGAI